MMETHPVQYAAFVGLMSFNLIGLVWVDRVKRQEKTPDVSWATKRKIYVGVVLGICVFNLFLDANFAVDTNIFYVVRTFFSVMPFGLVDLYFSNCKGIDIHELLLGLSIVCVVHVLGIYLFDKIQGQHMPPELLQTPMSFWRVPFECSRIIVTIVASGMLADLSFSPLHRYLHSNPTLYRMFHKKHHVHTTNLTSFINFYADATDDLVMAGSVTLTGALVYRSLVHALFPGFEPFSNLTYTFSVLALYLGHAHDIRVAQLVLPGLPTSLSPPTYHHGHHLNVNSHFGLTRPMDKFWDWVCGTNTIKQH